MRYIGNCNVCPLNNAYLVSGYGVQGGLVLVGEAPGVYEVKQGKPFTGPSGKLIRMLLTACDVNPDSVWWTNSVLCRPPENKTPSIDAVRACNERLLVQEMGDVKPQKVLMLGASALTGMTGAANVKSINKFHGQGMWINYGDGQRAYGVPTFHPAAALRDPELFRSMVVDLEKLLSHDAPMPEPDLTLWVPHTPADALRYIDRISRASVLSCDLETTGVDAHRDLIVSVGFGALNSNDDYKGTALIISSMLMRDSAVARNVRAILREDNPTRIVFQNGKYDLTLLDRFFGEHLRPNFDDTLLMHYTLDERPGGQAKEHSLKTQARVRYDAVDYAWDWNKAISSPEMLMEFYRYQGLDCYYTIRLDTDLRREIAATPTLMALYEDTLAPASLRLKEIEAYGTLVDTEYLKELAGTITSDLNEVTDQLRSDVQEQTGVQMFNPGSPKQIMEYIHAALPTKAAGILDTEKETLQSLLASGPMDVTTRAVIEGIIEYRTTSKLLQTYVIGFLQRVHPDGRIRAEFLLHGTVTGRLASRDPNLQNIPHHGGGDPRAAVRSKQIRNAFVAPTGYRFVEADFAQLELRVAAYYSGDSRMRDAFISRRDIHREVASQMFGKPQDAISDVERHLAKYFDFGLVYGRGAKSLAEGREMDIVEEAGGKRWTIDDAERFMRRFLNGFPDLDKWLNKQRMLPHTEHEVMSATGRLRRFPLVLGDGLAERQAINSPIQALASDICLHALMRVHDTIPHERARVLFTVHDSVALEVREEGLAETCAEIKAIMEDVQIIKSDIPFPVDIKAGVRWGEVEELL